MWQCWDTQVAGTLPDVGQAACLIFTTFTNIYCQMQTYSLINIFIWLYLQRHVISNDVLQYLKIYLTFYRGQYGFNPLTRLIGLITQTNYFFVSLFIHRNTFKNWSIYNRWLELSFAKHRSAVNCLKVLAVLLWSFAVLSNCLAREWPRAPGHLMPPRTTGLTLEILTSSQ